MSQIVSALTALTPEGVLAPCWVRIHRGRVVEAGRGAAPQTPDVHVEHGVLAPGFVDVHAHGGAGVSFTEGAESARGVLQAHRWHGTTTMLASLVSAPTAEMLAQTEALRPLVEEGELAAVHWEGPWISPAHRGAHDGSALTTPSVDEVAAMVEHPAAELVAYVTVAPELLGGVAAVRRLTDAGLAVGIGHTGADHAVTLAALEAGAVGATHLLNAMTGLHHREPGAALALLEHREAFLELICDGHHLHPAMIAHVWRTAAHLGGADRLVLVSDAMAGALGPDGDYLLGGLPVSVRDGLARLVTPDGEAGAMAGSTLTMADAVRYCIVQVGVAAEQVLAAATSNPARMVGLHDVGQLSPGRRADLVVLDEQWEVQRVMRSGEWLDAG